MIDYFLKCLLLIINDVLASYCILCMILSESIFANFIGPSVKLMQFLTGVLCLWFHVAGLRHPSNSHHLRHYCGYLFLAEC